MPLLFYGDPRRPGYDRGRLLYTQGLRPAQTKVFDSFRIDGLAYYPRKQCVANIWHMRPKKHTAISWSETMLPHEQTIFVPGFLNQRDALELARETFPSVVPSPIVFRFGQAYNEVLLYD